MLESHVPSFHSALGENTLHVVLSARQIARFTWLAVFFCHVVVPVFLKNTWNGCEGPGAIFRNADSPAYSESYPTTALACPEDGPSVKTSATIGVTTKRIALFQPQPACRV